jgi:pyruvate ferredoxin oxidoreductase delta subunit
MPNPKVRPFVRPGSPKEYPVGPCFTAGHLVETNASWRSERPLVTALLCTGCQRCVRACPDGAVLRVGAGVGIDYDFCKGCGICVRECTVQAITMVPERGPNAI